MLTLLRSVAKAGIQSASIMAIADISTQLVLENRSFITHEEKGICKDTHQTYQTDIQQPSSSSSSSVYYDPIRTMHWSVVGLTLHGPYFFLAFGKLDCSVPQHLQMLSKRRSSPNLQSFLPISWLYFPSLMYWKDRVVIARLLTTKV